MILFEGGVLPHTSGISPGMRDGSAHVLRCLKVKTQKNISEENYKILEYNKHKYISSGLVRPALGCVPHRSLQHWHVPGQNEGKNSSHFQNLAKMNVKIYQIFIKTKSCQSKMGKIDISSWWNCKLNNNERKHDKKCGIWTDITWLITCSVVFRSFCREIQTKSLHWE